MVNSFIKMTLEYKANLNFEINLFVLLYYMHFLVMNHCSCDVIVYL